MKDKCSVKRCRNEPQISYLGKWLCDKHWEKHCKEERMEINKKREEHQSELTKYEVKK